MHETRYSRLDAEESKRSFVFGSREMLPHARRRSFPKIGWFNTKITILISLVLLTFGVLGAVQHKSSYTIGNANPYRIAKVSMLYGDKNKNNLYERALDSHIKHAEKWGYPVHVKRENEYCGYWNKPTFMISKVAEELAKPKKERMEWLMWVDADSIILNPNIPAHIFLPPKEHSNIHIVAARDIQGLNTGVFFVRVHPWTISMFVDSMAFPLCHADVDLGNDADQAAMARTLEKNTGGPTGKGFKDGVAYLPKTFFNSYELPGYLRNGRTDVLRNFTGFVTPHAYEGQKGDFLVHLPGLFDDRALLMADWLHMVEARQDTWAIPLKETTYVQDTQTYWSIYGDAVKALEAASERDPIGEELADAVKELRSVLTDAADDTSRLLENTSAVKKLLEA